jgi:hypothetical protein
VRRCNNDVTGCDQSRSAFPWLRKSSPDAEAQQRNANGASELTFQAMEMTMAQKGAGGSPGAVTKKGGDGATGSTGTGRGGGKSGNSGKKG